MSRHSLTTDERGAPAADGAAHSGAEAISATRTLETFQTLLTALILALIFRSFFVEAFIIPTGSMAPTLLGRHGTSRCPACGWEFDYGLPGGDARRGSEEADVRASVLCPNCHGRCPVRPHAPARAGDRILVHKWPFGVDGPFRPRRWDVMVFRDPAHPESHYIKRLVGLPGEAIQILDGDVFIRAPGDQVFRIARKPDRVQAVLWQPVFDQSHVPVDRVAGATPWVREDEDPEAAATALGGWEGLSDRTLRFTPAGDSERGLKFDPWVSGPAFLQDDYAYNVGAGGTWVGDVRVVGELSIAPEGRGALLMKIRRDDWLFVGIVSPQEGVRIELHDPEGGVVRLGPVPVDLRRPVAVSFAHVDYCVSLRIDGRDVLRTTALDYGPDVERLRRFRRGGPVGIALAARGAPLAMRGVRVERDVHYTESPSTVRADARAPFALRDGEYFVLGDNSPDSHDSREWTRVSVSRVRGEAPRPGVVRADHIVGRAFLVYLPALLPLDETGHWHIPDLGRVRFVR